MQPKVDTNHKLCHYQLMSKFLGFRVFNDNTFQNLKKTETTNEIVKFLNYDTVKVRIHNSNDFVVDISKSDWNDIPEATRDRLPLYMIQDDKK